MNATVCLFGLAVCAAALAQAQTVVRYPYVQNVRPDRATILWTTLQSTLASVQFSSDRSFSRSVGARLREFLPAETGSVFPFYQHQADLTGLQPATEYNYRIMASGQNLLPFHDLSFHTAPAGPAPFTFLAFGDSGQGAPPQYEVAVRMRQENPSLVLHTGDITYNGLFQEFEAFYFDVYRDLMKRVPFFPIPGNHEYWRSGSPANETNRAAPYVAVHSLPTENVPAPDRGRYYSFDWGNVHFVALDSNIPLQDAARGIGPMLDWLQQDLQRTRQFWKVAYWHHAPYATGRNEGDPLSAQARQYLVPILERNGVQLVFNGHEHNYQRSYWLRNGTPVEAGTGTIYITTGGGGNPLYAVRPVPLIEFGSTTYHYVRAEVQRSRITVRALRADGSLLDTVTLAPLPAVGQGGTVNAASFTPAIAPGALVSVFGFSLAPEEAQAARLPLPTELAGTSVSVNGVRLPLLYVSAGQINAQLHFDAAGTATLRVTTPNGLAESVIAVSSAAPAIFSAPSDGRLGAITTTDGTLVSASSPARAGETVSIYLTGLGAVDGEIVAGQAAPASPLLRARVPVEVQIGGATVIPIYAGLAPGFAGLYQVNVQLPANLPNGAHALRIVAGGSASNSVNLEVR